MEHKETSYRSNKIAFTNYNCYKLKLSEFKDLSFSR